MGCIADSQVTTKSGPPLTIFEGYDDTLPHTHPQTAQT